MRGAVPGFTRIHSHINCFLSFLTCIFYFSFCFFFRQVIYRMEDYQYSMHGFGVRITLMLYTPMVGKVCASTGDSLIKYRIRGIRTYRYWGPEAGGRYRSCRCPRT